MPHTPRPTPPCHGYVSACPTTKPTGLLATTVADAGATNMQLDTRREALATHMRLCFVWASRRAAFEECQPQVCACYPLVLFLKAIDQIRGQYGNFRVLI